jgi:hypothetical protein
MFEVYRRFELAVTHAFFCERVGFGHLDESVSQRSGFSSQGSERLGPVERKYTARAGRRIAVVAEECLNARALIQEGATCQPFMA